MRIPEFKGPTPPIGYTQKSLQPKPTAATFIARLNVNEAQREANRFERNARLIMQGANVIKDVAQKIDAWQYAKYYEQARLEIMKEMDDFFLQIRRDPNPETYLQKFEDKVNELNEKVIGKVPHARAKTDLEKWAGFYFEKNRIDLAFDVQDKVVAKGKYEILNLIDKQTQIGEPEEAIEGVDKLIEVGKLTGYFTDPVETQKIRDNAIERIWFNNLSNKVSSFYYNLIQDDVIQNPSDYDEVLKMVKAKIYDEKEFPNVSAENREKLAKQFESIIKADKNVFVEKLRELDREEFDIGLDMVYTGKLNNVLQLVSLTAPGEKLQHLTPEHKDYLRRIVESKNKEGGLTNEDYVPPEILSKIVDMIVGGTPYPEIWDFIDKNKWEPGKDPTRTIGPKAALSLLNKAKQYNPDFVQKYLEDIANQRIKEKVWDEADKNWLMNEYLTRVRNIPEEYSKKMTLAEGLIKNLDDKYRLEQKSWWSKLAFWRKDKNPEEALLEIINTDPQKREAILRIDKEAIPYINQVSAKKVEQTFGDSITVYRVKDKKTGNYVKAFYVNVDVIDKKGKVKRTQWLVRYEPEYVFDKKLGAFRIAPSGGKWIRYISPVINATDYTVVYYKEEQRVDAKKFEKDLMKIREAISVSQKKRRRTKKEKITENVTTNQLMNVGGGM